MRINALGNTATDFASDDYIAIDGTTNGSRKMAKTTLLSKASNEALVDNIAPAFDATRTAANPYKALADFVVYNGKTYLFRNDHYGPWDPADVFQFDLSTQFINRLMGNVVIYTWGTPSTIPKGSLVRHNGLVYLALEELHYADGFEYNKVMTFSIENVIDVLKSNQPFFSIVPSLKYTYNKILDASGVEQDLSSGGTSIWVITDYIPVTAGKLYKVIYSSDMSSGKYSALYDSSKNFVESFTIAANSSYVMKVPEGVSYVRFSIIVNKDTLVRNLSIVELPINAEIGFYEKYRYSPNYLLSKRTEGYYIDSTGTEIYSSTGSTKWEITDYIPVTAGETIYYYNLNATGSAPMSAWYDSDKTFVSSFKQGQGKLLKVVVPSGVSFVRFSFLWLLADGTNFKFGVFDDCVKLNKMLVDSVQSAEYSTSVWSDDYLCINGDSIEATGSGIWPVSLASNIPWSNSSNIAVGGTRMTGQINSDTRIANIPATATIVITGGGTNDWAQNIPIGSLDTIDDPTTFYGAVHLYIQKVKTRVPDAIVVMISNPFGCCPSRFSSSHDDTLGIWNNNDNTLFDYAQAMKAVANFDSCYYIPVYEECGINAFNFTDYLLHEYNSGAGVWVYLHPNSDGAAMIEKVIETHLKRIAELYQ